MGHAWGYLVWTFTLTLTIHLHLGTPAVSVSSRSSVLIYVHSLCTSTEGSKERDDSLGTEEGGYEHPGVIGLSEIEVRIVLCFSR